MCRQSTSWPQLQDSYCVARMSSAVQNVEPDVKGREGTGVTGRNMWSALSEEVQLLSSFTNIDGADLARLLQEGGDEGVFLSHQGQLQGQLRSGHLQLRMQRRHLPQHGLQFCTAFILYR